MSARHRQHKKKIVHAKLALAERQALLVAYDRVILDMVAHGITDPTITIVHGFRETAARDCARFTAIIDDLIRQTPPTTKHSTAPLTDG